MTHVGAEAEGNGKNAIIRNSQVKLNCLELNLPLVYLLSYRLVISDFYASLQNGIITYRKNRIVIVTDCVDAAANELRATIIAELEKLKAGEKVEVEPIVAAERFSIINGAFLLRLMAEIYNPKSTVFLVVLNPLKTNRPTRARIIGQTKNGFRFVGENTGTLGWLIKDFGLDKILETTKEGLDGEAFVPFGGKYYHAPIAARIAAGIPLEMLGSPFEPHKLVFPDLKRGTILHIDNFGVVKLFMRAPGLKEGNKLQVFVNGRYCGEAVFTLAMKNLSDNTLALYPGSSLNNLLELGIVRGNAAEKLSLKIGDIIKFCYSADK